MPPSRRRAPPAWQAWPKKLGGRLTRLGVWQMGGDNNHGNWEPRLHRVCGPVVSSLKTSAFVQDPPVKVRVIILQASNRGCISRV